MTDRTFVDVRALLRAVGPLNPHLKGRGYYGQTANATHKEAFGFHDYVDLNTGVLLSSDLLAKIADPTQVTDLRMASRWPPSDS